MDEEVKAELKKLVDAGVEACKTIEPLLKAKIGNRGIFPVTAKDTSSRVKLYVFTRPDTERYLVEHTVAPHHGFVLDRLLVPQGGCAPLLDGSYCLADLESAVADIDILTATVYIGTDWNVYDDAEVCYKAARRAAELRKTLDIAMGTRDNAAKELEVAEAAMIAASAELHEFWNAHGTQTPSDAPAGYGEALARVTKCRETLERAAEDAQKAEDEFLHAEKRRETVEKFIDEIDGGVPLPERESFRAAIAIRRWILAEGILSLAGLIGASRAGSRYLPGLSKYIEVHDAILADPLSSLGNINHWFRAHAEWSPAFGDRLSIILASAAAAAPAPAEAEATAPATTEATAAAAAVAAASGADKIEELAARAEQLRARIAELAAAGRGGEAEGHGGGASASQ